MTSNAKISLNDAIAAMERAYERLEAATAIAVHERHQSAAQREAATLEVSQSWQAHADGLETELEQAKAENQFLKEDNVRLTNQLQQLQADYLELQSTAGHVASRIDTTVRQLDLILEH